MLPHLMQLNSVMQAITAGGVVQLEYSCYGQKYDMYKVKDALEERGYNVLGKGYFSVVVSTLESEMRNTVIKIGGCVSDAWLAFAVYAMNNPAPWLPVIHSIHMNKTFYVVEMEKLSSIKLTGSKYDFMNELRTKCVQENPAVKGQYVFEKTAICWHLRGPSMSGMQNALGEINDMHDENYMWRDDQLVLTDPYHKTEAKLPKAPLSEWSTVRVQYEDYRAELPNTGEVSTVGREAEVQSLREQPVDDAAQRLEADMGVLPQVREDLPVGPIGFVEYGGVGPVRTAGPKPEDDKRPFRLRTGIQGRRADILVVDDLAPAWGDFARVEKNVLAWMDEEVRAGRVARVHDSFVFNRDAGVKGAATKPESEVHNGQPIPEYCRVPKQAREGKPDEDGRARPPVRRGFRGGRIVVHKSRRVCADRELAWDWARIGEIGQDHIRRVEAEWEAVAMRALVGPGQGRAEWKQEAPEKPVFNGARVLNNFLA
ncbi:putative protein kinase protein [Rhizobium phage RHph_TM33]|uniref:Uncharacterized protein n=1 Tax=Rhizobium phage RHph_TM33 TaxID=2509765 RepID=A0A7S5US05_9CAUD|nr:putative protein kinase protein [Rhizobium phage RHph_TM33]